MTMTTDIPPVRVMVPMVVRVRTARQQDQPHRTAGPTGCAHIPLWARHECSRAAGDIRDVAPGFLTRPVSAGLPTAWG
jgi:hypothetical protein